MTSNSIVLNGCLWKPKCRNTERNVKQNAEWNVEQNVERKGN